MFCTKCGHPNNDQAIFCVNCGQPVGQSAPPQPQQPQQQYAPPQQPYAQPPVYGQPQRMPMDPRRKKMWIWIAVGAVVLTAVLLMVFLIPRNAIVGKWYGEYGQEVTFKNGGGVSVGGYGMELDLDTVGMKYEIMYEEPGYIEGFITMPMYNEVAEFWYENYGGREVLHIEGEEFTRDRQGFDLDLRDFDLDF